MPKTIPLVAAGLALVGGTIVGVNMADAGTELATVHCVDATVAPDGSFTQSCKVTQPTSTPSGSTTATPTATAEPSSPASSSPTSPATTPPSTSTPTPSSTPTPTPTPTATPTPAGKVLWNGDFDTGSVPHGANGKACNTGAADGPDSAADQYGSTQEMGNTACTNKVEFTNELTRTADSTRALKITMGANQQRELLQSKFSWQPDAKGTTDLWYGMSIYYDPTTWNQGAGYKKELSGTYWDDPFGLRTDGANGSLNGSSDLYPDGPHLAFRRNTVKNNAGFYVDGLGLDKIDLGPVVVGKWMDLVIHVRWSTTTTNALREVWRDGQLMGRKTSLNAVDTLPHHLRVGQYQATNIGHTRVSYFDNVRIGTSYEAVDPSK